jgi:hypothetical protein
MLAKRIAIVGLAIVAIFALEVLRPRWAPAAEIPLQV